MTQMPTNMNKKDKSWHKFPKNDKLGKNSQKNTKNQEFLSGLFSSSKTHKKQHKNS